MPDSTRVLLIAQDDCFSQFIQTFLENSRSARFQIHRAASFREGVRLTRDSDFDAILLDLAEPDRDVAGVDRITRLSTISPTVPIVAFTEAEE